jgi:hypothetical protein
MIIMPSWGIWSGYDTNAWWNSFGNGNQAGNNNLANNNPPAPPIPPMLPAPLLSATPADQAQSALTVMHQIHSALENQLAASPAYLQALADVRLAQADLDAANAQVNATLSQNKDYAALLAHRKQIEDRISWIHRNVPEPDINQLTSLASENLAIGKEVDHLRQVLLKNDPSVAQAQQRLVQANVVLQQLRKDVELAVMADPTWQAAHKQFEDNRQ